MVSGITPATFEGPPAERPLLAPWLRLVRGEGRLVLEYGDEIVVLGGVRALPLLDALLPLLDGTRTADEAAAALGVRGELVEAALAELHAHGLVLEGPPVGETALFCAGLAREPRPRDAEERLAVTSVAVVGESTCAQELAHLLEPAVGRVERAGWDTAPEAHLAAVAPSPGELPLLEGWNERALERSLPWLQVLPFNGRFAAIGPLFVPCETCCHACFRLRRGAALGEPELLEEIDRAPAAYPQPRALAAALAGLAATLLTRWLAVRDPAVPGVLFALELDDGLRVDAHRVLRVPRCPACSSAVSIAAALPWGSA